MFDGTKLTIGHWYRMKENGWFDFDKAAKDAFLGNFEELRTQVAQGMEALVQDDDSSVQDIMTFLDLSDHGMGFQRSKNSTTD